MKVGFFPHELAIVGKSGKVRVFTHPEEILLRLTLDKLKECRYNTVRREIASRNTIRWRLLLFVSRGDLTPLRSPEGSGAYDPDHSTLFFTMVTYEALFALGMLIIAIIELCSRKR